MSNKLQTSAGNYEERSPVNSEPPLDYFLNPVDDAGSIRKDELPNSDSMVPSAPALSMIDCPSVPSPTKVALSLAQYLNCGIRYTMTCGSKRTLVKN